MAGSRVRIGVIVFGFSAAAVLAALAIDARRGSAPERNAAPRADRAPLTPPTDLIGMGFSDDPSQPRYPDSWKVGSVAEAASAADFRLFIPDAPVADPGDLMGVFVYPSGAVALVYPSPGRPEAYILQEYVEVWEAPWTEKDDPLAAFQADVTQSPTDGKSVTTIRDLPALVVAPHSKDAVGESNAAFVEFVVDGIDIEISGGEDLNALIAVAESIIDQSSTDAP